jgi:regulator of nucleoside diphosphate kinase
MRKQKRNILITSYDYERLSDLLKAAARDKSKHRDSIEELAKEMEGATIVSSEQITDDTVTMNSKVYMEDLSTHEEFSYQVVFPSDADLEANRISVLAPVGTALLGYKVGDTITWKVPGGLRKLRIKKMLYQPEAEGNYGL